MITLLEVATIIFLFTGFGVFHSILASKKIKSIFLDEFGDKIAFYRLAYNLVNIILFVFIWEYAPKPDIIVYDLPYPYDILIFVLQAVSLFGILWSASVVEMKEFIGYSQIQRYLLGVYDKNALDENLSLRIRGAYKISRHPMYFFFILFLGFRPTMDLFYLTAYVCFVAYFYLGSIYEEKKMVEEFGEKYVEYQKKVPRIIPYKIFSRKNIEQLSEN